MSALPGPVPVPDSASDRPRRPVSERQLAANRANAKKCTGPRTPEGKARASLNALKHGQAASAFAQLVSATDGERRACEQLMSQLYQQFAPRDPLERVLVERLGMAYLRLLRVYGMEGRSLTLRHKYADAGGVTSVPAEILDLLRYEAAADRALSRTVRELRRLGLVAPRTPASETTGGPAKPTADPPSKAAPEIAEGR